MTNPYVPAKIGVVASEPGFGDLSMADQVDTGLRELGGDIVVDYEYFIATDETEAGVIITQLSNSGGYDLIVVVGGELADVLKPIADAHLNQKYACIGGEVDGDNVFSTTFKQHEGAFLAGVLAALASLGDENRTGTSIVGIIGSVETDPTVAALVAGFKHGVDYAISNYSINVTLLPEQYVGSYNDSSIAEVLAKNMFNPLLGDATVVFAPVRASMLGIRNALIYANATWFGNISREPLVIAAEGDQDYFGLPNINTRAGSSWIITSVVPRSDLAVYRAINQTLWDEFQGNTLVYDLDSAGDDHDTPGVILTHSDFINNEWTPQILFDEVEIIRQLIINDVITVSETYP